MSEFNEELLNDVDDFQDIGDADEDALLQDDDDGDVLDIVPEELEEGLDDSRVHISEQEEEDEDTRREKFAVERQLITAPETAGTDESLAPRENNRFPRNNRGFQRGRGGVVGRGRFQRGRGRPTYGGHPGRNKTVLINPRFQGVVHVNNNGSPMQTMHGGPPMQQQQIHSFHGPPHMQPQFQGPPMQPMHQEPQMQHGQMPQLQNMGPPLHNMGPPVQNIGPPGQQLQYIPPQQQPYMPQPLPPGVQQSPIQSPFMHGGNYPPSPSVMMHNQPPPHQHGPPPPNYQIYNQGQGNMSPMGQNFSPSPSFNNQGFPNNNSPAPVLYNQGNGPQHQNRRELFTQKRKVMTPGFPQNKKVFVQDRLGPAPQPPKVERPSVVKEVTVTNITTVKIEEDEDTRDLRLKIEQQKREREAILQWKEKRRMEMVTGQVQEMPAADQKPIIKQVNQRPPIKQEIQQPQNIPVRKPAPKKQIVQPVRQVTRAVNPVVQTVVHTVTTQSTNRVNYFKKQMGNNIVITNGYSRKGTKYQMKKDKAASRVVLTVPTTPLPIPEPELKLDKKHLSSFLADRKILTKDESLMSTRKVVIKNISTSTGDKKIFQISKSIGEVQKLHRDKNQRQATITFKSVASAHAFFKKYQRHMLDLSMIEVSLCPMTESDE